MIKLLQIIIVTFGVASQAISLKGRGVVRASTTLRHRHAYHIFIQHYHLLADHRRWYCWMKIWYGEVIVMVLSIDTINTVNTDFVIVQHNRLWVMILQSLKKYWHWVLTYFYLFIVLIIPIISLLATASETLFTKFWFLATEPVAVSAYCVTLSMALVASLINGFFGFILAWVLVRYNFPGRKILDAAVDLPFALPTSVAGLTLATVYSPEGWLGAFLHHIGFNIVFTRAGIAIAMIFVSFPFVVRTVQPVLQEIESELEEASWSLGASPWDTFKKVVFPPLFPTVVAGITLAFSRAIGEYGSVVVMASNIPLKDLIASVLVFQNLEQYEYVGATVIGTVVLLMSLILLLGVNTIQSWNRKLKV